MRCADRNNTGPFRILFLVCERFRALSPSRKGTGKVRSKTWSSDGLDLRTLVKNVLLEEEKEAIADGTTRKASLPLLRSKLIMFRRCLFFAAAIERTAFA